MTKAVDASDALRKAAAIIQRLERRIESTELARREPIAIVGAGCRLPGGVVDLEGLWRLLAEGRDTVGPIPGERFDLTSLYNPDPTTPGTTYVRDAAVIDDVERFDAEFFGISPREAAWIDPQHRLLLECAHEALENAGILPRQLRGTNVGVYVGLGPSDYAYLAGAGNKDALEGYLATGTGASFSAGRVSFLLGLQGPAVTVDTACSSSLTAIHLACRALRNGECRLALAGGVQLLLSPQPFLLLSRLRALSPDGRCKTFSDSADGYGRGEGCGVIVLKLLSEAQRDGDPILGLIRGSALNQDGASSGLTTPNGSAQQDVLRHALEDARLAAADVEYVEAHGTGTALGDPIEVDAIAEVYARGRTAPLQIGAIKTNIGHLESAAGVAGILKVLCSFQHDALPPSLHAETLSRHVDWASIAVQVVRELQAWAPTPSRPRRAGVSAFGMSGTNAHVVLEEPPRADPALSAPARAAELVVLTGKTEQALKAAAGRLREHVVSHPEQTLGDIAYSLVTTRTQFERRLSLTVSTREKLVEALDAVASGETPLGAQRGVVSPAGGKLAWLFTGQGAQRLGMGRELYAQWAAFREALDEVSGLLDAQLEVPLREVMWAEPGTSRAALLDQTGYTQPALFAFEWALAQLWRSWGVEPELLLGHSIGELTAATVAGVFSLADGARLVCARARLMQALPAGGAMVSVGAPEGRVSEALGSASRVSLAAVNGPSSVVIAGREADVAALTERFQSEGVQTKRLSVSHAFHSELMEPMLEEFGKVAESVRYRPASIAIISDTTGRPAGAELGTARYWVQHVRETVRFAAGVEALGESGAESYLEIGPRATLLGLVPGCLPEASPVLLSSLRGARSEPEGVLDGLGAWVARGGRVDWKGVFPSGGRRVSLPNYAWQRERFWIDLPRSAGRGEKAARWPLGGHYQELPGGVIHHALAVGTSLQTYLRDHVVHGAMVVPGAFFVSVVLACAAERWPTEQLEMEDVEFVTPLFLDLGVVVDLNVLLTPAEQGASFSVEVASRTKADGTWATHARARVSSAGDAFSSALQLPALLEATHGTSVDALLDKFEKLQIAWGPEWRWMSGARSGAQAAMSELTPPSVEAHAAAPLHPVLLDNGFGTFGLAEVHTEIGQVPRLPFAIGRVRWIQPPVGTVRCGVQLHGSASADSEVVTLDLGFWDESGALVAAVERFAVRIAPPELFLRARQALPVSADHFYRIDWTPVSVSPGSPSRAGQWLLLSEQPAAWAAVDGILQEQGALTKQMNVAQAVAALDAGLQVDGVICWWQASQANQANPAARAQQFSLEALRLVQALVRQTRPCRLWWVTRSAVAATLGDDVDPAAATLWGLGRTVMQEQPDLRCTLVDVDREASLTEVLLAELGLDDDENQVAWRGGKRHVARLVRAIPPTIPDAGNYQIESRTKGSLDGLTLTPSGRRAPSPGELELEVRASGLNFRDVLNALGMYPGEAGPLGGECSGLVTAVGAGVERFAIGDRVMAFAPGTFRGFVTVDARLVAPVPGGVSLEQAATIPAAFLTAWYALHDLAGLQRGERIVIHAAAGGVGMAAVQLARWIGAEVLATASPSKWEAVRALGVRHVASSRNLDFVPTFKSALGGAEVVLNSLAGEFVDASLGLLSSGGRFIEMGKTDLREVAQIAQSHPGVRYHSFDLTVIDADRIAQMLEAIGQGFATGHLVPLPLRTFSFGEAEAAFRHMAQARHVGKIVLLPARDALRTDGTVLITGGLGALGLEVARRLIAHGAQRLVLTGRRGLDTPGAAEAVAELEALGAVVRVVAVDVADRAALARTLSGIATEHPLRGVVHAAGLLDDGLLTEQTPERFASVLAPKVLGASHLDQLTRGMALDFFVLFSSMAGTLGSAAQAGYAAANAFLDGLATHRRAQGLPALSLAWGPWAESGMAAALDTKLQARFARQGISMLSTSQGLSLLEGALRRSEAHLVVVPLDVRVASRAVAGAIPPVWRALLSAPASRGAAVRGSWSKELSALPVERRLEAVGDVVRGEVARILSLPSAAQVPAERPLQALGLDSLMAVELRNVLGQRAGVPLSATLAFDHPTVEAIAAYLLAQVLQLTDSAPASAGASPSAGGLAAAKELLDERWHDKFYDPDSQLDLNEEAALEGGIVALPTPLATLEPTSVFLTGATGFLGAFLLWELLRQTQARVTCLVRARTPEDGLRRIESNLATYGLWKDAFKERLSVVVGDLGQPLLGLDKATFRQLAAETDSIYNNGANVSFVLDYRDLRPSHVQATRELLRLASLGRPKALHHVSSVTAFDAPAYRGRFVSEATVPAIGHGIRLPYAQCKWVSEAMVRAAGARGIPITIHRPSFIGGATNGAWNTTDFLCRVLKGGAIDIGCLPGDVPLLFDFSPVDFVASSIVYLSRQNTSSGKTFHLQHPTGLLWNELAEILPSLGYPIERVSYATWLERLAQDRTSPIHPLLRFFTQRWQPENLTYLELTQVSYRVKFESEETTRLLDAVGIRCAPLDRALFQRYFKALAAVGFIQPPRD